MTNKAKISLIVILLLLAAAAYGYLYYRNNQPPEKETVSETAKTLGVNSYSASGDVLSVGKDSFVLHTGRVEKGSEGNSFKFYDKYFTVDEKTVYTKASGTGSVSFKDVKPGSKLIVSTKSNIFDDPSAVLAQKIEIQ